MNPSTCHSFFFVFFESQQFETQTDFHKKKQCTVLMFAVTILRLKQCWDEGWKTAPIGLKLLTFCHLYMMISYTIYEIAVARMSYDNNFLFVPFFCAFCVAKTVIQIDLLWFYFFLF